VAPYYSLTFLTDYGAEDGFVAACHGVCAKIAADARIIDITHLVPPGDIRRGAAVLAQTVPYLPTAVHVAVVDPGVGTARRGIAVATASGSVFVGPDNGLLSWAIDADGGAIAAVSLTNKALWLEKDVPATFHGRDIFMPVAAHLFAGIPLERAGDRLAPEDLVTLPRPHRHIADGTAEGEVLTADRFGNIQLSVTAHDAQRAGLTSGTTIRLRGSGHDRTIPFGRTFGEVPPGDLIAYTDSAGYVSIAVNGASAAAVLSLLPGTRVTLTPAPGPSPRAP
jgi:hypothetical protein